MDRNVDWRQHDPGVTMPPLLFCRERVGRSARADPLGLFAQKRGGPDTQSTLEWIALPWTGPASAKLLRGLRRPIERPLEAFLQHTV